MRVPDFYFFLFFGSLFWQGNPPDQKSWVKNWHQLLVDLVYVSVSVCCSVLRVLLFFPTCQGLRPKAGAPADRALSDVLLLPTEPQLLSPREAAKTYPHHFSVAFCSPAKSLTCSGLMETLLANCESPNIQATCTEDLDAVLKKTVPKWNPGSGNMDQRLRNPILVHFEAHPLGCSGHFVSGDCPLGISPKDHPTSKTSKSSKMGQ